MKLFAIDPGKVTGVALSDPHVALEPTQMPLQQALDWVYEHMQTDLWRPDVLVVERFTITERTIKLAREHSALSGIGALEWMAQHWDVPFVLQNPSDAKRLVTDARLRALGWYRPTVGGHANDAARHLAYYLARNGELKLP